MGELGKPAYISEETASAWRREEFEAAAAYFKAEITLLHFPDLMLAFEEPRKLAWGLLRVLRSVQPGLVLTFHPDEMTQYFDHPDHTAVGQATRWASASANVAGLSGQVKPMEWRPDVLFWTTDALRANFAVPLNAAARQRRRQYIDHHYQSQHIPENVLREIMPEAELYVRLKRTDGTIDESAPATVAAQTETSQAKKSLQLAMSADPRKESV